MDPESFPFPLGQCGRVVDQYARRRQEDPLGEVLLPSGDVARLAVRYDDAVQVMSDPRFSRDLNYPGAPQLYPGVDFTKNPDLMLNMDAPRHTRLRRLLAGTLTPRVVAAVQPRIRELAETMVDGLQGPEVEFVHEVAFPFAVDVICEVMGTGLDRARVRAWSDDLLPTAGRSVEQQMTALHEFAAYCGQLIAEHRANPADGVLDIMIKARDDGDRLSDEELVHNTLGMFLAGHEATGSVLSRGMLRLLHPRDGYEQLVRRPELIPTAVEELLRTEVPGDGAALRVAKEDIDLPSGRIRKGEAVIASFVGANHDDAVYDEPLELRLDRQGPANLTFGRGPHFCLGANLGRMELQQILAVIVERLPELRLAVPADEVPWTSPHDAFKRPTSLPLRLRADG